MIVPAPSQLECRAAACSFLLLPLPCLPRRDHPLRRGSGAPFCTQPGGCWVHRMLRGGGPPPHAHHQPTGGPAQAERGESGSEREPRECGPSSAVLLRGTRRCGAVRALGRHREAALAPSLPPAAADASGSALEGVS